MLKLPALKLGRNKRRPGSINLSVDRPAGFNKRQALGASSGKVAGEVPERDFGAAKSDGFFGPDCGLQQGERVADVTFRPLKAGYPQSGRIDMPARERQELQKTP